MELDLQVSPEEIMSRVVELGRLSKLDLFCFELSKFANSSATDIVFVTLSKHSS